MTIAEAPPSAPIIDEEEAARARSARINRIAKWTLPSLVMALTILFWHLRVTCDFETLCSIFSWTPIPHYVLPGPLHVWESVKEDWGLLWPAMLTTARLTVFALVLAIVGGVILAVAFTQSKWAEMSFFPYAVILQVTPVIAVAPLLQIYMGSAFAAALACAWIVAFFPILSNTTIGLKSADHNLDDLFTIYGASRWQRLRFLAAPSALPFFLGGLKIAGGLALIGAVVAEFVIGRSGTGLGLASTLLEASYRFNFGRLYAALILISAMGIVIFAITSITSHLLLRKWHESALKRD
ncbi:MAG: ABC transporter permease [Pseudomonadota bacterium]